MIVLQELTRRLRPRHLAADEAAYRRLAEKGFAPAAVIDVGAYEGHWTSNARRFFPGASFLMVEAQPGKLERLQAVAARHPATEVVHAVLADVAGTERTFYEMETGSSLLPEESNVPRKACVRVTSTLDDVAGKLPGPIFLKVDVQGAELQVLAGGARTLARCAAVQLEVALLPYNAGAPTFVDVVNAMCERGFVPYDIAGEVRPNFSDLVQVDLIFVPEGSPLRPRHFTF